MQTLRWTRRLSAAIAMLVVAGCGQEVTSPTSRPPLRSSNAHPSLSGTSVDGDVITATDDEGSTISVDRANHTATFNGETIILTQEAADSLADQFLRMLHVEQAANEALNAPPPPDPAMCDDPSAPCELGHATEPTLGSAPTERHQPWEVDDSGALWESTRTTIATAPVAIGSILPIDAANIVVDIAPGFTCHDASLAIYDAMPGYRAAKKLLIAALAKEGASLALVAKALPQVPSDPTTWYGRAELYSRAPILNFLYANFEHARIQLNYLAIQFRAMNCYTPPSSSPPSGGGGSQPGGERRCYYEITYNQITGVVSDVRFLGCW